MRPAPAWLAAALLASSAAGFAAGNTPPAGAAADAWRAAIADAAADGLDPAAYDDAASLAQDLGAGRLDPRLADPDWHIPRPAPAIDLGSGLLPEALRPASADYARLREALRRYRAIRDSGGWPTLPAGEGLRAGQRDPRVATLRERLRRSGDFDSEVGADPWFFDAALDGALRRFQQRVGLPASGILDEATRAAANVGIDERIGQLAVALERWRWLPRQPGEEHVWVNIVTGTLEVVGPGGPELAMRVIVGHPSRPTPAMSGELRQVSFNPAWSVPRTIAVEDLLPREQEEPGFLAARGFHVFAAGSGRQLAVDAVPWSRLDAEHFPYRLRQDPGPGNALGRVKIAWDNPYDIYLHDTPSKGLFDLNRRTLSSGCIRLQDAAALATLLLSRDRRWDAAATAAAIDRGSTQVLNLRHRLPVYVVYLTAWVEADGSVQFRRDSYGRDARVLAALQASLAEAGGAR
ncbi:MAG: L,D-transpeptidase family protein [Gammaproteobacteria bacterium]|nr:MAG: L,D-transpeptidase family protein [Gammaproteobacteria bacterium]